MTTNTEEPHRPSPRMADLDGLRAFAIIFVISFHSWYFLRFLEPIARYSFSMYLFHPLFVYLGIITFIGTAKTETVSVLQYAGVWAVAILGSMLLGYITWRFIEHPAIRFGKKKFG